MCYRLISNFKVKMLRYLLAIILFNYCNAENVIHCTDSNFEDTVKSREISLVKFYAPWCGHCKKMAPEFETAAGILLRNDPPVTLIKVDCTTETSTCSKYGVSGYPTVKIFRGLEHEEYNGGRTSAEMVKVMKSKAGPSSKLLETVEDVEKFLPKPEDIVVMGFFTDSSGDLATAHKKAADSLSSEFTFAHTSSSDVLSKYGHDNVVILYRPKKMKNKFESSEVKYTGTNKVDDLKSWIQQTSLGLCGYRTPDTASKYKNPLVAVYYDVDYVKNTAGTNYVRNRVMKAGVSLKNSGIDVTLSINSKDSMSHEIDEFGLKPDNKPVVGMWDGNGRKYAMSSAFSVENLEKFVRDVFDGKVPEYLKSEDIPDNSNEAVKIVVAKNFDEIVNDETKDVLIEFYAPWCGHCKSLAPKYEELAKKLSDEPDIVIAKMDATANDVPKPYDVRGFPTIYFSPKSQKSSPKQYSGEREVDGFIKYLAKEATDELRGYKRNGKAKKKDL